MPGHARCATPRMLCHARHKPGRLVAQPSSLRPPSAFSPCCLLLGGEGGYAVVLATVDESADLWATNGKKGDSYKTTYQVRGAVGEVVPGTRGRVLRRGGSNATAALVLGRRLPLSSGCRMWRAQGK